MGGVLRAALLAFALASCVAKAPGYESDTVHADGSPVTAEDRARQHEQWEKEQQARRVECRRLYATLGDVNLTQMQIEAIRVSMNVHQCGGLVP